MGSTPTVVTVRNTLLTRLQSVDGAATVTSGSDSWTFNRNLVDSSTLGGDPRADADADASAALHLRNIEQRPGGLLGDLTSTAFFEILARAVPTANTAEKRLEAAAELAGDICAALNQGDRTFSGTVRELATQIEARDGQGDHDHEWAAGCGLVIVRVEVQWANRMGV